MSIIETTFNKTSQHPLQSWEWGEFRKEFGNEVIRFNFGQIMLHRIPGIHKKIGSFIKGPKPTTTMLNKLKILAKEQDLVFIKLEPNCAKTSLGNTQFNKTINLLEENSAVPGKTLFTPTTFWVNLQQTEEELLSSFHPKTRYNIKLAQRRGVEVVEDNSQKAFEKYLELTRETVKRQNFYAHTKRYHKLMWKHLHQSPITNHQPPIARLLTALYNDKVITAWIVFVWKDFLYYPYGASSNKYKNLMANNLMMWEAIKYGQKLGLTTFDLWGREEGKGFTKFKEGYNPKVVDFLGTWDLPTSPLYWPYRIAEPVRWTLLRAKGKLTKPTF